MAELNQQDMETGKTESGRRRCGMDMVYTRSMSGILKGNQIGWTFLAFAMSWFCGLSVINVLFAIAMCVSLLTTTALFVIFAFSLEKKISRFNVYLVDFLLSIIATVAYFALCLPMVILSVGAPLYILAGVFGFLALAGFFGNIWYSFKKWRASSSRAASNNQPYDTNQ